MAGLLRAAIARLVDLVDAAISRRADAEARAMGLTIERIPGTRIHVYSRGGRGYSLPPDAVSTAAPVEDGERR